MVGAISARRSDNSEESGRSVGRRLAWIGSWGLGSPRRPKSSGDGLVSLADFNPLRFPSPALSA